MPLNSEMRGKVVAIVGACSQAGASIARSLAGKGATLMLGDERLSALHALAARIGEEGGRAQYRAVDPGRQSSIDMLVAHTLDAYGRLDLLLHLGAVPGQSPGQRPSADVRRARSPRQLPTNPMNALSWLHQSHS